LKRLFDVFFSSIGLIVLLPVFAVVALGLKMTSPGPVFFRQVRMGRHGSSFRIFKFRTMKVQKSNIGCQVTAQGDSRVTPVGNMLRRSKLDELPQLINVLRGEMSLVGPRPEVLEFVDLFPFEYGRILKVRPGITHPATLSFRYEEDILATRSDPRQFYIQKILPKKLAAYEANLEQSLVKDILTIIKTVFPGGTTKPYGPEHFVPEGTGGIIPFPTMVENIPDYSADVHEASEASAGYSQIILP
jgi:lipopolysaccharide/colanic/teichoic acid biosynthesis glycosyltransferase